VRQDPLVSPRCDLSMAGYVQWSTPTRKSQQRNANLTSSKAAPMFSFQR
jgi:hypothetical protein